MNGRERQPLPAEPDSGVRRRKASDFMHRWQGVLWSLVLIMAGWAMRTEIFMQAGPRWTEEDAKMQRLEIMRDVREEIGELPTPATVIRIESKVDANTVLLQDMRVDFSSRLNSIETLLRAQ